MNIFVTSTCPEESAIVLPDLHINKMSIECCQMLAYVASPWLNNYGTIPKKDGTPYKTSKTNPHLKHICTVWVAKTVHNSQWLIYHGLMICEEFERRFGHTHSCYNTLIKALEIFPDGDFHMATDFVRAMPDELKYDKTIDTFQAYKLFLKTKIWPSNNYNKIPSRKPDWL
jgi:hypothetical protein